MGGKLQEKLKRESRKGNLEKMSAFILKQERREKELYIWGMEGTLNPDIICAVFK